MKRICFLVDSVFSYGGVQRVTAVIAKQLSRDYDVSILTFDNPKNIDKTIYGLDEANITYRFLAYPEVPKLQAQCCRMLSGLYKKILPKTKIFNKMYAFSSFPPSRRKWLQTVLKEGNYDAIVGVHIFLAARLATMKPNLGNAKTIGWVHNSYNALFGADSPYAGTEIAPYYIEQFKTLDSLIVLTKQDAEIYKEKHHFRPTVIYNPLTLKPGARSEGKSKKFLAVGRLSKGHKGFDILIDAFHLFAEKNKEWTLDIVGEGPEHDHFQQMIDQYGLNDRITIHPFTNNVQKYYSQAQIYVLSSRWEGFGLVLVEAMSHGLPIISSDIPTSKELLGDFGLYFRSGDTIDLASKLDEATRIDWQKKSDQAVALSADFSVEAITQQWKEIIK